MSAPTQNKTVAEQIQEHPDLIPSLPDVVTEALKLVDDPEVGPGDFEKVLQRDPPLVATILRLANSPVYGFAHKKESVRDAIIGMGLKGLRGVLMGSTLKRFLGAQYSSYGKDPMTLWRHAQSVGVGAKALTKRLDGVREDPEEMFVAGLLHDLGKLLLAQFLKRAGENVAESKQSAHLFEKRVLDMDHQEAGRVMAERWNLIPMMQAVIVHHHSKAPPPDFRTPIAVVRLADLVATELGYGAGRLDEDDAVFESDLDAVGVAAEDWGAIREELAAAMTEAVSAD